MAGWIEKVDRIKCCKSVNFVNFFHPTPALPKKWEGVAKPRQGRQKREKVDRIKCCKCVNFVNFLVKFTVGYRGSQ